MKRVLSLVLALVLVLGMMPTAFAADMSGAEMLLDKGFITGKDGATVDAKLDVNAKLTRAQLAALIAELNGAKEEAAAFAQPADFTDADTFQDWAKPYIAYAQQNEWMNGFTDGTFRADAEVPAQQLAAVLLNALGYDFEWANALEVAAGLGIMVEGTALTRGEAFEAMWVAVSEVNVNGEEMTLGVKLGKLDPPAPVVTDLMIESVTATNLKEIVVTFNQEIDEDTVAASNITLSPAVTGGLEFAVDGKVMTITAGDASNNLVNQGVYKLTVDKVESLNGVKLAKVTKEFTAFDATLPTVEGIVVTGPKTFDIMFNEPIETAGTVTVKSANTTLAVQSAPATGLNKVSVTLFTALVDGTTYDVTVTGFADYAGYNNVIKTINYTYAKDATAPVVELVSANQQYVVVKFNKPVTGLAKANFYHTFSAWGPMDIYKTKADMDASTNAITTSTTNVTTVYVKFATTGASNQFPLQPGAVNVHVLGKVGSVEVKDNWGNALASTVLSANVVADLEAPTVTKVEATSNTNIAVTFSKAVNPGTVANYEVLKSDGTAISGLTFTVSAASATKVNLGLSKSLLGETVIVNVKNIEDTTLNKNKLVGTSTTTITFEDKEFAGVNRVEFDSTAKVLYVVYNEAMADSAIAIANYKLNDDSTIRSLAGPVTFFSGNKVVKIELSTTEAGYLAAGTDKLLISNAVKDVAGNGPTTFQLEPTIVAIGAVKPAIVANGIKAIDKNTVTVQYDQELVSVLPTNFELTINNADYAAATSVAITNNSTGSLVTLTFAADIPANVPAANVKLRATYTVGTVNVFGQSPANLDATAPADKIAPALSTKELTALNTITLTYNENIDPASVSIFTYTVAGSTVSSFNVNNAVVTLTLAANVAPDATPSVTQALDILDANGNKLVASAAVTAADKVAPLVADATEDSTTQVTIEFSEKLDSTTVILANFTGTATPSAVSLQADGKTVVVTVGTMSGTETIIVGAGVKDVAGNAITPVTLNRGTEF